MTDSGSINSPKQRKYPSPPRVDGSYSSKELRPSRKILKGSLPDEVSKQKSHFPQNFDSFEELSSSKLQGNSSVPKNSSYIIQGMALQAKIKQETAHTRENITKKTPGIGISPKLETRKLTQLLMASVPKPLGLLELTHETPEQSLKNSHAFVDETTHCGTLSMLSQEAKSEEKFQDISQSPPQLKYTNTMGTKDRAKRDIIAYIREKKIRDTGLEQSSSFSHQQYVNEKKNTNNSGEDEQLKDIITSQNQTGKVQDGDQGAQGDSDPAPTIVYTNSMGYKSRARQDIINYIKEKKENNNQDETSQLNYTKFQDEKEKPRNDILAFDQEKPVTNLQLSSDNNQETLAPPITYTNTYGSKRKAKQDIQAFIEEKKTSKKLGGLDSNEPTPVNVSNEQLSFSPKLNIIHNGPFKRKLGELGRSRTIEKNNFATIDLTLFGSPARIMNQKVLPQSIHSRKSSKLPPLKRLPTLPQQRQLSLEKSSPNIGLDSAKKKIELNSPESKQNLPSIITSTPQIKKINNMSARGNTLDQSAVATLLVSNSTQNDIIEMSNPRSVKIDRNQRHRSVVADRQIKRIGDITTKSPKLAESMDAKRKLGSNASFETFNSMILNKSLHSNETSQQSVMEPASVNERRKKISNGANFFGPQQINKVNALLLAEHSKEMLPKKIGEAGITASNQEKNLNTEESPFIVKQNSNVAEGSSPSNDKKNSFNLDFVGPKSNLDDSNHIRLKLKQQQQVRNQNNFKSSHGLAKIQPVKVMQNIFSTPLNGME